MITKISSEILRKINPAVSAFEWMQGNVENRDVYNASIERDKGIEVGQMFRRAISSFDQAVNPFLDESLELDNICNCLEKVKINGVVFDPKDGKTRKGCCRLEIIDLNTGNSTTYHRDRDGFSFQLLCKLDDEQYLSVLHYFSTISGSEFDKGEIIAVNYFGNKTEFKVDINFNITNGRAGKNCEEKTPATQEQMAFVYSELLKAIEYAKEITIKNMQKQGNTKKIKANY